jgi:arylsulfatase A-like enzyme
LPVRNGAYRNESYSGYAFGVDAVFSDDALGGLALSEVTIADALKRKGYKTKMIGRHCPKNRHAVYGFDL